MGIHSLRLNSIVINNWSDLIAALKAWWHAPINLERKPKLPEPSEYKSILDGSNKPERLPQSVLDILSKNTMTEYRKKYYDELRARLKRGDILTAEERYRLRMNDHISGINDSLDHPDEHI
jgi:hypothetical protein